MLIAISHDLCPFTPPLHSAYTVSTILALVLAVHTIVCLVGLSISAFQLLIAQLLCVYSSEYCMICCVEPLDTLGGQ